MGMDGNPMLLAGNDDPEESEGRGRAVVGIEPLDMATVLGEGGRDGVLDAVSIAGGEPVGSGVAGLT